MSKVLATNRCFSNCLPHLRCALENAQSLGNKLQELHYLLYGECFDLVLITESWLDSTFTHGISDPESKYNVYRKDRNRHGGGICLFVSKLLQSTQVDMNNDFNSVEIVCVDVYTTSLVMRVFVAYHHLVLIPLLLRIWLVQLSAFVRIVILIE